MMRPDLLVVHAVDDGHDRHDVDAGAVQVLDRAQLHVEQVAHAPVRVRGVPDAVELQIGVPQACFGCGPGELGTLGELDAVGRRLDAVVAHFPRVADGVEEVGRECRLATGKLHRHLPLRLDADGVVEHLLDVLPAQLVHEAHLIRIHEAGIAHHVAAVGEVDREHRPASMLDGAAAMIVQRRVVVRADVASRKDLFEVLEERRVDRHDVFEVPVDRTVLDHENLTVALHDLRLDLAHLFAEQD